MALAGQDRPAGRGACNIFKPARNQSDKENRGRKELERKKPGLTSVFVCIFCGSLHLFQFLRLHGCTFTGKQRASSNRRRFSVPGWLVSGRTLRPPSLQITGRRRWSLVPSGAAPRMSADRCIPRVGAAISRPTEVSPRPGRRNRYCSRKVSRGRRDRAIAAPPRWFLAWRRRTRCRQRARTATRG